MDLYKPFIFGAISAVPEISATHWIDVMKITQQSIHQGMGKRLNLKQVSRYIYNKNGLIGFYKGFIPRVSGSIPMRFMFWGIQDTCNKNLPIDNNILRLSISGILGGAGQTIIDTPIEVAKINHVTSKIPIKFFSTNTLKTSIPSFFPNLYRNVVFSGSFCLIANILSNKEDSYYNKLRNGMIGGAFAAFISHPLDVVKTDLQRNKINNKIINNRIINNSIINKSTCKLLKEYIKKDISLLYSGLIIRMIHTSSTMGVGYLTISLLNKYI